MEKGKLREAPPEWFRRVDQGVLDRVGLVNDALTYYGLAVKGRLDVEQLDEAWFTLARKWPVLLCRQVDPKRKALNEHAACSVKTREKDKKKLKAAPWFLEIPLEEHVEDVIAQQMAAGVPTFRYAHHEGTFGEKRLNIPAPSDLSSDQPTVMTMPDDMDIWVPNAASSVREVVGSRQGHRPALHLEANVYDDATVIGICSPHAFMDALGLAEILRAWCKVLAGKADEVKPLEGLQSDFFQRYYGMEPKAPWGWSESSIFGLLRTGLTILLDTLQRRPSRIQNRAIYLPKAFLVELKQQCSDEIKAHLGDDFDASKDWISTSDAVNAWVLRMAQAIRKERSNVLGIVATRNLRLSPPDPMPEPFLYNALLLQSLAHLRCSDIFSQPMGMLALSFRRNMRKDMPAEQTRGIIAWHAATLHGLPMPIPSGSRPFGFSNWSGAKLFDFDFSPALVDASAQGSDRTAAGKADEAATSSPDAKGSVFFVGGSSKVSLPMKDFVTIRGVDSYGGMWLSGLITGDEWHHPDGFGPYIVEPESIRKETKA